MLFINYLTSCKCENSPPTTCASFSGNVCLYWALLLNGRMLPAVDCRGNRLSIVGWLLALMICARQHTHSHNAMRLNSTQRVDQDSALAVAAGNQACNFVSISENHQSLVGKCINKCQSYKRTFRARGHACAIFITPPTHAPPVGSRLDIDIDCTLRR